MRPRSIQGGGESALHDALYNARYEYEDTSMVQALNDYANDVAVKEPIRYEMTYPRYWHGYLVVLKPLLLFFNVSEIRLLNLLVQTALFFWMLWLILAAEPFLWFGILSNHTWVHYWFAYRELSVTILALGMMAACFLAGERRTVECREGSGIENCK